MADDTRRTFLKKTGAGAAAAAAIGFGAPAANALGANEKLVGALVGCGGRGPGVAKDVGRAGVNFKYACDANERKKKFKAKQFVTDMRKIRDDKEVNVVVVATPDHWHTPASILMMDAGKHVYCEKPCAHNVREGALLVEAQKRNKVVCQHGTQGRSDGMLAQGVQALKNGVIGKVLVAKAYNIQKRGCIGKQKPSNPPRGLDHDLWVGPAEMMPFQKNRFDYDWRWWYNYGTGDCGNDGAHEMDLARWGLGVTEHPTVIAGGGGKMGCNDDQQHADTMYVSYTYPDNKMLVFEMRLWSRYGYIEGNDNGNAFYGTDGWMFLTKRGKCKVYDNGGRQKKLPGGRPSLEGHQKNFVNCIKNGKTPAADMATVGFLSAALCLLGNVAVRTKSTLQFDGKKLAITNNKEANELLGRKYRKGGHWAIPKGAV